VGLLNWNRGVLRDDGSVVGNVAGVLCSRPAACPSLPLRIPAVMPYDVPKQHQWHAHAPYLRGGWPYLLRGPKCFVAVPTLMRRLS